jgi:enoyl-CoA hydratase/carnithine racemase
MDSSAHDLISVKRHDDLTVVRFNWQGSLPGTDLKSTHSLWDFLVQEKRQPSKVLVLLTAPELVDPTSLEVFSVGSEGAEAKGPWEAGGSRLQWRAVREENVTRRVVEGIRGLAGFVIGVVQGEVALRRMAPYLACDYRIASEDSVFVNTIQHVPVAPSAGVPWLLTRLVGGARALQILLEVTGFSAHEARELGLVNYLASPDAVEDETLEVAHRIASLPDTALVSLKREIVEACEDLPTYLEREAQLVWNLSAQA